MIAGRLHWKPPGAKPPGKVGLAAFDFPEGTLILTEAGSKRRASLYFVRGEAELAKHDPGGLEVLDADHVAFRAALQRENHTLKRALTDPHSLGQWRVNGTVSNMPEFATAFNCKPDAKMVRKNACRVW